MNIEQLTHPFLEINQLITSPSQSWCFYGENSSGINNFLQLLEGRLTDVTSVKLELDPDPGILSFHGQQELFEEELRNDDTDFLDRIDPGTTAATFLGSPEKVSSLLAAFNLNDCLDTGLRQLSSGQNRKLVMLREVIRGSRTIILQNPFDGLDMSSCTELNQALEQLSVQGVSIIILVNSLHDIPAWCSHIGFFEGVHLSEIGPQETILEKIKKTVEAPAHHAAAPIVNYNKDDENSSGPLELIRLKNGFAGYGGKPLFEGLDLTINRGDHTLVYGKNGCGKSTLLDILIGDNPKCYANDLRLFGKQRGCGESIWQLKQQMGIVSPSLHRDHRVPGTALHVVLSGLFDSIGLYEKVSTNQIQLAKSWLTWLDLERLADVPFKRLEFSEQRLILIGRGLIKKPLILILDEATQGLDDKNRYKLLDLLDLIAKEQLSTILFVSHRTDEYRPFFTQKIQLDRYNV
ncbi:ATP-binding cassette domain-containing protein [Desulforhopalus sp. 52FAK]